MSLPLPADPTTRADLADRVTPVLSRLSPSGGPDTRFRDAAESALDFAAVLRDPAIRDTELLDRTGAGAVDLVRIFALVGYDAHLAGREETAVYALLAHERANITARGHDAPASSSPGAATEPLPPSAALYLSVRDAESMHAGRFGSPEFLLGLSQSPDETVASVYGSFRRAEEYVRGPVARTLDLAHSLNDNVTSAALAPVNAVLAGLARDTAGISSTFPATRADVLDAKARRDNIARRLDDARCRVADLVEEFGQGSTADITVVSADLARVLRTYAHDAITPGDAEVPALRAIVQALDAFAHDLRDEDAPAAVFAERMARHLEVTMFRIDDGDVSPNGLIIATPDAPAKTLLRALPAPWAHVARIGGEWFRASQDAVADTLAAIALTTHDDAQRDAYMVAAREVEERGNYVYSLTSGVLSRL